MTVTARTVFLIDGIGAAVSAMMLGLVLPLLEQYVDMPRNVLLWLALAAVVFGICSFGCYYVRPRHWRRWLRAISWMNLAYCVVTVALVVIFRERLTFVGVSYFLLECLVIVALVLLERRVLANPGEGFS